jgi:hypothetical protein
MMIAFGVDAWVPARDGAVLGHPDEQGHLPGASKSVALPLKTMPVGVPAPP